MISAAFDTRPAKRPQRTGEPELVQVTDLTGGLDRRKSPTHLSPERARRLRNVRLATVGEWQPRPGWLDWLTASLGGGRPQGAQRIYLDAVNPFTLLAWSGNVYKPSDAGVAGAAVVTGLSATNEIFFPYDATLVAVFDGATVPKKSLDGTTWTQMGISVPAAAPTLALAAGGSLVNGNTYEFSYAYQDDGLTTTGNESATAQIATTAGNLTVNVTVVASSDPQVDTINVYARDVTAGESIRRFAGSRANTNGVVTVTTNNWSAQTEAPTRRNVPPALAFGVPWKNRWWAVLASDPTRIHFTEIFENQSWPTLYYIDIPFTRGDEIAAIVPLGDVLLVFGQSKQAFLIIGQTSLDFEVRPSAVIEGGCFGPRASDIVENGILHAVAEGVYLFDGASDRLLSYDFETDWREMVEASSEADLSKIAVTYHRRDKEIRIAVPTIPMYAASGEWVLDLARTRIKNVPAWSHTDRPIGGYVQWDGDEPTTGNRGRLFSWSNTIGRIYEESVGTSANGANLIAEYEGPELATELRDARFLALYVEFEPNEGQFGIEVACDGVVVASPSVNIGTGLAAYGSAIYGTSVYGAASRSQVPIDLPLEAEGGTIKISGQYEGQAAFKWFTYAVTIHPEPEIRGMA